MEKFAKSVKFKSNTIHSLLNRARAKYLSIFPNVKKTTDELVITAALASYAPEEEKKEGSKDDSKTR